MSHYGYNQAPYFNPAIPPQYNHTLPNIPVGEIVQSFLQSAHTYGQHPYRGGIMKKGTNFNSNVAVKEFIPPDQTEYHPDYYSQYNSNNPGYESDSSITSAGALDNLTLKNTAANRGDDFQSVAGDNNNNKNQPKQPKKPKQPKQPPKKPKQENDADDTKSTDAGADNKFSGRGRWFNRGGRGYRGRWNGRGRARNGGGGPNNSKRPEVDNSDNQSNASGASKFSRVSRGSSIYSSYIRASVDHMTEKYDSNGKLIPVRHVDIVTEYNSNNVNRLDRDIVYYENNRSIKSKLSDLVGKPGVVIRYNTATGNVTSIFLNDHFYRIVSGGKLLRIDSARLDSQTIRTPFRLSSIPTKLILSFKFCSKAGVDKTEESNGRIPAKPHTCVTLMIQSYHFSTGGLLSLKDSKSAEAKPSTSKTVLDIFADLASFFGDPENLSNLRVTNFYVSEVNKPEDVFTIFSGSSRA